MWELMSVFLVLQILCKFMYFVLGWKKSLIMSGNNVILINLFDQTEAKNYRKASLNV